MQTLTITFDETTGKLGLDGPIQNKLLAYGMLELAKDALRSFSDQSKQTIIPATIVPQFRPGS